MRKRWIAAGCGAVLAGGILALPQATGQQRRIATATAISPQEKSEGAKAHPQLLAEFGGPYAGPQSAYVTRVGQKIAVQSGLSNAQGDFTVTLLNSPVNNAFAIPGGYVYVTRQLLGLMNDEAELAGVLGHEVGHVAAQHGQRRQKAATRNAIGGTLLQVLAGAVLGDSGLGNILQQGIGTASQALTLKFSRSQEYEADDLGIRYLASAGYDPHALSSTLASLAAQNAIDQRVSGNSRTVPEWASTHPDPAARVSRALQKANATGARSTLRNRDAFLAVLDGTLYGDDPKQGVIEGNRFRHPDLRLSFAIPAGYTMENGTAAVSVTGPNGQAQFTGAAFDGDMTRYIGAVFSGLSKNATISPDAIRTTTINGIPASYASARANAQSGPVDVTVFVYRFGPTTAYHFMLIAPAGRGIGPFEPMVGSLQRLSAQEAAAIRPRRVQVVTVKAGDSVATLAGRMAYADYREERFRVLNGLAAGATVRAGQKVKIVSY
ncbi:M48 family metalloprotease [Sphingobium algorifonticola]|uniref:LysM peptidoglycan-binding domain-containing protein n=1 Tax=Sphingobium algorifonticola TaxID=2008318 RepID=A0A437J5V7_9SPHN|nr:M48 family metalloprotease [Sphingobium algorifonticola]RVT40163.1 LysM peptidoglycan-binding domain-containing protein [Sphingobium algorifonticola]